MKLHIQLKDMENFPEHRIWNNMTWFEIIKRSYIPERARQRVDEVMSDGKERTSIEIIDEIKEALPSHDSGRIIVPSISELKTYLSFASNVNKTGRKFVRTGRDDFNNYLKYKMVSDEV